MQLKDINNNTNYDDFAGQVFDFGVGKFRIEQRFNDKDTDFGILQMYKSWGLAGHDGLDLTKVDGDDLPSFTDGKVVFCDWFYNLDWIEKNYFQGGGRIVIVYSNNRLFAYYHLASINVTLNQEIKRGDIIGKQGGSGFTDNAFSSHLHFKMFDCNTNYDIANLQNGFFGGLDPLPFLISLIPNSNTQQISQTITSNNSDNMSAEAALHKINTLLEQDKYQSLPFNDGNKFGWNRGQLWDEAKTKDERIKTAFEILMNEVNKINTDLQTQNAKYHVLLEERNNLFDEVSKAKKNSQTVEKKENLNKLKVTSNIFTSKTGQFFMAGITAGYGSYQLTGNFKVALGVLISTICASFISALKDSFKIV